MEINRSALAWFAMLVRSSSGTKLSSERVYTTSAPGSRCSIIFPSRSATSRHRSFSINPVAPIVPVSWPPWPGSITILPIFKPSVRVSVDCPSRVGCGVLAGRTKSGFAFVAVAFSDFDLPFFAPGSALRATAVELLAPLELLFAPAPAVPPLAAPGLIVAPLIVLLMALLESPAGCRCRALARIFCAALLRGLSFGGAQRGRQSRISIQINHKLRRIACQHSGVILHSVHVQHYAHHAIMILRHAHRGQQAAFNANIPARHFRRQPRRVQIKKDAVGIRDVPGNELHAILKIDGHPRRIAVGSRANALHSRKLRRRRSAHRLAGGAHRRVRAVFFGGWRCRI